MHDNERLGKKLTTWGWWLIAVAPVLISMFMFAMQFIKPLVIEGLTLEQATMYAVNNNNILMSNLNDWLIGFLEATPNWLTEVVFSIGDALGVGASEIGDIATVIVMLLISQLSWAIFINIIHICYDFLTVLFKLAHNFFGKVGK